MNDNEKQITNSDILRYIQNFDEDFSFTDFTPEELFELMDRFKNTSNFKEKYFEFYDDVKCMTRKRQDW